MDEHYVAVHKPPNLLVHRSPISRDSVFLLQMLRDQIGQRLYPIHRLDRATSGIILFGRHPEAARYMAERFEKQQVVKTYLALARGWVAAKGSIDHPVADRDGNNQPQPAITGYSCIHRIEVPVPVDRYPTSRYSLVSIRPRTGRRQQIRKHFKHISHHLIGDTTHGSGKHNRFFRDKFDIDRLLLLAIRLDFFHPYSEQEIRLKTEPEIEWQRMFSAFDWNPVNLENI